MASPEHVAKLEEGVDAWNAWRREHPQLRPDLQGVKLSGAVLTKANLACANLSGAVLGGAWLDGADLRDADLSRARLHGTNLSGADLRGAILDDAELAGASLLDTDLRRASLRRVSFQSDAADLLPQATAETDLSGADLRYADVRDARLSAVDGLIAKKLAGADLTGAALPPSIAEFAALDHVESISKNARTVFLGLIGACAFSWLSIGITTDPPLLLNSGSIPLPIIQTRVPWGGFYLAAPAILLSLYIYLHMYLQRMWDALGQLPAVFPDGRTIDQRAYPWLLTTLVPAHSERLRGAERPAYIGIPWGISFVTAWVLAPATIALYWARYLPRHGDLGLAWIGALVLVALWAGIAFYLRARFTIRQRGADPSRNRLPRVATAVALVAMAMVAWATLTGERYELLGVRTHAVLSGAELSRKADGWRERGLTAEQTERQLDQVVGAKLEAVNLRGALAEGAFLVKARLAEADLRDADLSGADLRRADLRHAELDRTDLSGANLSGADLRHADLAGANLSGANLRGADMRFANLDGVNAAEARLDGVRIGCDRERPQPEVGSACSTLTRANLAGASLDGATLYGVNADRASLQGASLRGATIAVVRLDLANLDGADLLGAHVSRASMRGVTMLNAHLDAAVLDHTDLRGALLKIAKLRVADLKSVDLRGANLSGADAREAALDDTELDYAVATGFELGEGDPAFWDELRRSVLAGRLDTRTAARVAGRVKAAAGHRQIFLFGVSVGGALANSRSAAALDVATEVSIQRTGAYEIGAERLIRTGTVLFDPSVHSGKLAREVACPDSTATIAAGIVRWRGYFRPSRLRLREFARALLADGCAVREQLPADLRAELNGYAAGN